MDMSVMYQHSPTPCLADGRVFAVQNMIHTILPVVQCAGFNQTSPTNFNNQQAFNQTERNKSAGVEFGWNLNLHIFRGTGLDTSGLEETWQHTSLCRALSMYTGCNEC